jgi:hypothetical protein
MLGALSTGHERELLQAVDLCLPDGRLDPDAIGWSRRPLHRCNLNGPWGRQKRWDYWAVSSADCALSITYADLDYLGLATVAVFDFASGRTVERGAVRPLARGFSQPDRPGGADLRFRGWGLSLDVTEQPGGTRLQVSFGDPARRGVAADVLVRRPPGHETLNVVIPWSERRFQYTSKQNTLPAEGTVHAGGRRHALSSETGAFGCLDFGRGVWPFRTTWNWASASGVEDGRTVGLQLGGKWTDGTGLTENALCIDGRLHKIGEDLQLAYDRRDYRRPWTIEAPRSGRVRLRFVPFLEKTLKVPLGLVGAELHLCFGHFSGVVVTDDGEPVPIGHLLGWAEEFRGRW